MPRLTSLPLSFTLAIAACSGSGAGKETPPPDTCSAVPEAMLVTDAWTSDPHYCVYRFGMNVPAVRSLAVAPNNDIFLADNSEIRILREHSNGDRIGGQYLYVSLGGLNHGLAMTATHVYASTVATVFRWPYTSGDLVAAGPLEVVVDGIEDGGHSTRTLLIDAQNRLYVSVGSASNVDVPADPNTPPRTRALILRFDLNAMPTGGFAAASGEIFAAGLRNEVGLTIDSKGRMWGVENGRDNLMVNGEDIHFDNPGEEVNLFDTSRPGRNYGYPFCWSEGIWMGAAAKGRGTQHLDPEQPGGFTEAKCQDASVVVPPAFTLGAHLAPLGIVEYRGAAYPSEMSGSLFVVSHGSWNREIGQVGRTIIRLKMGPNGPIEAQNFLGQSDGAGGMQQGVWSVRPSAIVVDNEGLLVFSDEGNGTVNKIGYRP